MSQLSLLFKDRILSVHPLNQNDEMIVGQASDCHLQIDSLAVSEKHAKITYDDRLYSVEPIDSDSIILINDINISEKTPLSDGDEITIGKHSLVFNFDERNNATEDSEVEVHFQEQLNGWLQYINGSEMGTTKQIRQKMRNISDEHEENIALISKRADGFYLSYLKGDEPPKVNDISIGEKSLKLENNSEILIGEQKILFFME